MTVGAAARARTASRPRRGGGATVPPAMAALSERVPGGVRRGELDLGGRVLRWVEAGQGGPTVVLVADSGAPALTWAPVVPELARFGRVVAYDRAGLGASDFDAGLTLETQLADLVALVEHLGDGPCVLAGQGWGGLLAQLVGWQRPELVGGLVLVDPVHEEFHAPAVRAAEAAMVRIGLLRSAVAPGAGAVRPGRHQWRTAVAENRLMTLAVSEIRRRRSAARTTDVPLAVLSATEGLPAVLRTRWTILQSRIAERATRGTHIVVRGAGHVIHADDPGAVTAAVLEVAEHARQSARA
ncbi:alpha/beta fold hydrolase [Kitasatospora sp. NPDC057904]|uniref:alpha/beta fold hydrolase n=1 Tax=Kitasatospora sp. NPDC057904 TaxID=3346275 RepID=UPI0036DAD6C0